MEDTTLASTSSMSESSALKESAPASIPQVMDSPRTRKSTLTRVIPSDRLTTEKQISALKAFAAVAESNENKPVTNERAGDAANMAAATIVVTNAFFCEVGLLTRNEGGFVVSQEVTNFFRTERGLSPETAPEKLRPLFEGRWFMQVLTPRLHLSPMDVSQAVKLLGEECGATREHVERLEILINFLVFVKCLSRDGNQLRLTNPNAKPAEPVTSKTVSPPASQVSVDEQPEAGLEKYSLTLNPAQKRKIVLWAPPEISQAELKRIQNWLSFQLIVTEPSTIQKLDNDVV